MEEQGNPREEAGEQPDGRWRKRESRRADTGGKRGDRGDVRMGGWGVQARGEAVGAGGSGQSEEVVMEEAAVEAVVDVADGRGGCKEGRSTGEAVAEEAGEQQRQVCSPLIASIDDVAQTAARDAFADEAAQTAATFVAATTGRSWRM